MADWSFATNGRQQGTTGSMSLMVGEFLATQNGPERAAAQSVGSRACGCSGPRDLPQRSAQGLYGGF
jgi:hypothetical protein